MATGGQTTNEAKYENQRLVSRQIGWELDDLCSRYEKVMASSASSVEPLLSPVIA